MSRFTALFFHWSTVAVVAMLLAMVACGVAENYPQAHVRVTGGKQFVLLKGKRLLMAHDPVSAFRQKTYEDSMLLPLPVADGVLQGHAIPVDSGCYAYDGEIKRQGKRLFVNLSADNYDDHRKDPVGWNGEYEIVNP